MPPTDPATASCPCDSGSTYDSCCGPYIRGQAYPPTAQALMRSRYTAYVVQDIDYLWRTHHPETRGDNRRALERWAERATWLGLTVLATEDGSEHDHTGIVEFRCRFFDEQSHVHHERSSFCRLDGQWVYVNGLMLDAESSTPRRQKVGRNEPCPCGSGRKYKRCCGAPGAVPAG